jgi:hypothetical protein
VSLNFSFFAMTASISRRGIRIAMSQGQERFVGISHHIARRIVLGDDIVGDQQGEPRHFSPQLGNNPLGRGGDRFRARADNALPSCCSICSATSCTGRTMARSAFFRSDSIHRTEHLEKLSFDNALKPHQPRRQVVPEPDCRRDTRSYAARPRPPQLPLEPAADEVGDQHLVFESAPTSNAT